MDEQQEIQEQSQEFNEEPSQQSYSDDYDDTSYEDTDYDNSSDVDDNGEEPEISINKNGELKFRDDFFGDMPDSTDEEQQSPKYYTDEELQNTPYEQWDFNRMPDEVKRYAQYLNAQTQARNEAYLRQQQVAQRPQTPPFIQEVKPYTAKELASEAEQLAVQRLGLDDPDDFDAYESEHQAALNMAMQELSQKRNNEVAAYQRQMGDYQQLQILNANIAASPDFGEFKDWFVKKARSEGTTPAQLNRQLAEYANNTHDFGKVRDTVLGWYQLYQRERSGKGNTRGNARPAQRNRQMPPKLESTRGGGYDSRRSVNLKNFGDLDPDAQAQVLMDMGIV